MKTTHKLLVLAALAVGAANLSAQQPADAPAKSDTNAASGAAQPAPAATPSPSDATATPALAGPPAATANATAEPAARTDGLITMNFHNASLETVLNHMSTAAG